MDYSKVGYNKLLTKRRPQSQELTQDDVSLNTPTIPQSSIVGQESTSSPNGNLEIDWKQGKITSKDARDRVVMGQILPSVFGIKVVDNNGNTRLEATNKRLYLAMTSRQVTVSRDSTGDFTDIQKAVEYINDLGGGIVFLRNGTYYPTSNINLYSNITLIGEDNDNTIIDFNYQRHAIRVVGVEDNYMTNVTISNLTVKNSWVCEETPSEGNEVDAIASIYIIYGQYIKVEGCYFIGNYNTTTGVEDGNDITVIGGNQIQISNCLSSLSGTFCYVDSAVFITIENNNVDSPLDTDFNTTCIAVSVGAAITIRNNYLFDTSNGIVVLGSYVHISGNTFGGFAITAASAIEISGTAFSILDNIHIQADGENNRFIDMVTVTNSSVIGNIADGETKDPGSYGIYMEDCDRVNVTSNNIKNFATGMALNNECDRCSVTGNISYGNTTNLTDNSTNSSLSGNVTA